MSYYMYVALQGDDKISVINIDPESGKLSPQVEVSVPGGPFTMAISPDRKFLYAGCRDTPHIASFQIDQDNGGITQNDGIAGALARLYKHGPERQVCAVGLLPRCTCSGTSYRR